MEKLTHKWCNQDIFSKNRTLQLLITQKWLRYSVLKKFDQLQILHPMMHKLYSFASVDFWLTVRMRILNHDKLDHTQAMYLWFSISLYIHKTDSEVKMRVHMSAYSTTPSVRSTCSYFHLPVVIFLIHVLTWTAFMWVLSNFPLKLFYRNCLETDSIKHFKELILLAMMYRRWP